MSFFTDLPAYPPTLDTGHADAAGLIHSWLFNKGSGTTVKDDVTAQVANLTNGPSWDAGGGVNFPSYGLLDIQSAGFAGVAAPFSVIAGILVPSMSDYHGLLGAGGTGIYLHNGSNYVNGFTYSATFTDGISGISSLSDGTPYVLAWRVSAGNLPTSSWIGNVYYSGAWNHWLGRIAFLYIFDSTIGAGDVAGLAANVTAAPYAIYGVGGGPPPEEPWPSGLFPRVPHLLVRR